MHTVRTTMRPDVKVEVGDAEYIDLQRQGLLAPDGDPTSTSGDQPAVKKTTTTASTGASQTKEG